MITFTIERLFQGSYQPYRHGEVTDDTDLHFVVDMFKSSKIIDFEPQYKSFLASDDRASEENYSVYETYVKFGEAQQESRTFRVRLER